ncbi:aryl-alcohol oxidase precursor [Cyathus striatus]|nr:aryl-alcohol oxidase precursor [Cyathus striatus]
MYFTSFLSLLPLISAVCATNLYHDVDDLPTTNFDFIIVGGGNAGLVIANRLTENPKFNVLVIEAGPSNEGMMELQVPFFGRDIRSGFTPWDWNSTSTPQPGVNGRALLYARAYVLEDVPLICADSMIWLRGSKDDFDRWANVSGDPGWSWDRMLPYMKKNEKWTPPTDGHNTSGQFDPSIHGFNGILPISLPGFPGPTDDMVVQAVHELNDPWMQSTISRGVRSSAATSYYEPFSTRRNLYVVVDTTVTRILRVSKRSNLFKKVEFTQNAGSRKRVLTAQKEVILSAGVIGTPNILLHSGIGDSKELGRVGINSTLHLPDVGKHFHNQAIISFAWNANTTSPKFVFSFTNLDDPTFFAEALAQWEKDNTGALGDTGLHFSTGLRLPTSSSIFANHSDPSAGINTPHYLLTFDNGNGFSGKRPGKTVGMTVALVAPESRGSVTINSTNSFDPPIIDMGTLASDFDIFVIREGYQSARKFFSASVWQNYVLDPIALPSNATTAELDLFIQNTAGVPSHAVGTASMSPFGAKAGVVNPDLSLKGASGLRVVDGSVLPYTPSANTQAPIYAIAERAADLIKASWE